MADTKTTKTIGGGTLTTTPTPLTTSYSVYENSNSESANVYGFAAIKVDGSVVAWGQNSLVPESLNGDIDAVQIYSNKNNFVALRNDGALIPLGYKTMDAAILKKLDGTIDVTAVASTNSAFAALRADGSVITWGDNGYGGDSNAVSGKTDAVKIFANTAAFAALRADGSVVAWGNSTNGGDVRTMDKQLDGTIDVKQIYTTSGAFAALREDGSVITWGNKQSGGNSNPVAKQLDGTVDVVEIYSMQHSFAALREDGSVVTWGGTLGKTSVPNESAVDGKIDVKAIVSNNTGFAALRTDGSVVAWGDLNSSDKQIVSELNGKKPVAQLYATSSSFAAVKADGSVTVWGQANTGGDNSAVKDQLNGNVDVKTIYSNFFSFAALREDGSVVTWGNKDNGGNSSKVNADLNGKIDVINIMGNNYAFAALRADGSVVTWGNGSYGGESKAVAQQLDGTIDVINIYANEFAFSALRADGSVITWGNNDFGGNSKAVANKLNADVVSFATIQTDDFYNHLSSTSGTEISSEPQKIVGTRPTGSLVIEGIIKENETLTLVDKIIDADGLGKMSYQWLADGEPIIGANQLSYVLSQRDVGKKMSVAASYTDDLGVSEKIVSNSTEKVVNTNDAPEGKVSISGSAMKGQILTASNTLIDKDGINEISYQWLRDGKNILNAKNSTYTVTASDLFKKISVKATYTDSQKTSEFVTSAETSKVTSEINHAPAGAVMIEGEMLQNHTLSVSHNIFDADGIASGFNYQWLTNNIEVKGATEKTYFLKQEDVNKTVSVKVSYTDKLGKVESVLGGVVQNENDKPEGRLMISGDLRVNETLTVKNEIVDIDGLSGAFSYVWLTDGDVFAEGEAIVLTAEQIGKEIIVIANYTDNGGTFETVTSSSTTKVLPQPQPPTGYISIMGDAKQEGELSVLSTLTDANGLGNFTYQWYSGDTLIKGATNSTYTPTLGDTGEKISVNVQYVDGDGALESVLSVVSTPVIRPSNSETPLSGDSPLIGTEKNDVLAAKSSSKVNYSISGLAGNDVLVGEDGNDTIDGGRGHDKIIGGKGNDSLLGAEGNDTLKGGQGADTMLGGDGDDYYVVDNARDVVKEENKNARLGGNDTVESTISYTLDKNIENLVLAGKENLSGTGNEFDNEITGNTSENLLKGEAGDDTIFGYKGIDTIFGGDNEDVLDGGENDDEIYGDAGDDFLRGGEGHDILDGGDGEDVAVFDKAQSDYEITVSRMADKKLQFAVKYIGDGVNEGTDILKNMEMAKFADDEVISLRDISVFDSNPPEFKSAVVESNRLTLAFDDFDILSNDMASANAFVVRNGGIVNPVTAVIVNQDAKTVELTLTNAVQNGQTVSLSYTDPTKDNDTNAIQDESGNDAASFKVNVVENKTPDTAPPEFESAMVTGNSLVMTYSDSNLLSDKTAPISAFKVTNDGFANPVKNVAVDVQAKTVTLTLENAVKNAQLVTLDYKDLSSADENNAIQDALGNDAQSITRIVTNNTPDIKPPLFASAMVQNENKLLLIYIEANDLDAVNIPPVSAFNINTGGVDNPVKSVNVDAKAKTVTLELTKAIKGGETIQFSYSDSTTDNDAQAIQDVAGNDAISIPEQKFVFNASDMNAPVLTGFTLPKTIDVSEKTQTATFKANFIDDNSGVHSVRLDLDKGLGGYPYSSVNLDKIGNGSKTVPVDNQDGIVKIINLYVKDFAGNEKTYSATDLQKLEISTAFQVIKDTTAPYLTSLTLPSTIDVTAGKQNVTFSAKAADDGVGVSSVSVYWDKPLSVNDGTSSYARFYGNDGNSKQTVQTYSQIGTFKISSVSITDKAGNSKSYLTDELKKLGFATSFEVIGNGADKTPPVLNSLTLPTKIDVSKGNQTVKFDANVTDDNSGISSVYVNFDKYYNTYSNSVSSSTGKSSAIFDQYSADGTYKINSVSVYDVEGNYKAYSNDELAKLGFSTSFEVSGAGKVKPITPQDTTPPVLKSLSFPKVDLNSGDQKATFSAVVTDDMSSIRFVTVNFDQKLSLPSGAVTSLELGSKGTFTDTVQKYSHSGTFNIQSVYVQDTNNNSKIYSADELKKLGIQTSFEVSNTGDSTPPVFKSAAVVDGNKLIINYTDNNALSVVTADKNAFTVTNNGTADSVTVVAIDTAKNMVTLTLNNEVKTDAIVTLSYKDPTTGNDVNAIQDVAGNDAVSIKLIGTSANLMLDSVI